MSDVVLFPDVAIGYTPYLMAMMEEKIAIIANRQLAVGDEIPKGVHQSMVTFFSKVVTILEENRPQFHDIIYVRTLPILRKVMAKILGVNEIIMENSAMLSWLKQAQVIVEKINGSYVFTATELGILQTLPSFFHDLDAYGQKDLDSRRYASWDTDAGDD